MASATSFSFSLFLLAISYSSLTSTTASNQTMIPMPCSSTLKKCNASLYHANNGLQETQIASFYSVNPSQIKPIARANAQDYLISVPCACESASDVSSGAAYFYDTSFEVKSGDSLDSVSNGIYNGQVWVSGDPALDPGANISVKLLCGCVEEESRAVVTYTVQSHDTLSQIGNLLSAQEGEIVRLNKELIDNNPAFIESGWVLFVPTEKNGIQISNPGSEKKHKWTVVVAVLATVTLLSISSLIIIIIWKRRSQKNNSEENPRATSKSFNSIIRTFSMQHPYSNKERMENSQAKSFRREVPAFESEKPVIFTIEEIDEATGGFHHSRKIGEGGYGTVYHGVLGDQEVAIKKMRSNKSKEFLAELKVLCKIHHINVVELLGYASGDDHLYLVYEFVHNGSLSDHLHDPLKKGHQPLSWTARTQIALEAAKGIEYIHDHTKARYVHRDIKTANILLDEALGAKVADFGLVKLVGRTNDDELIATRLVGTPGYLPPESVKELQVTPKTDVFAFGVVLAELITGRKALVRDNQEPKRTKSLITLIYSIFQGDDVETALEAVVDENLGGSYPMDDVFKMGEIAAWCLSEDPVSRPEMREIVASLSQLATSAVEWEASLGGNSQVFSGVFTGR